MPEKYHKILFFIFIISGFCGLLYQIVWMRLALTFFGVITPIASVVVSAFMFGLALGNWAGGKWIDQISRFIGQSAILLYMIAELIIGIGAFVVPSLFELGHSVLLSVDEMSSYKYLFFSSVLITISIIPWCFCMGTTIPVAMAFFKQINKTEKTSFSFLYLANVLGAMLGALISSFVLFELIGFKNSLALAGTLNFVIALICFVIFKKFPYSEVSFLEEEKEKSKTVSLSKGTKNWFLGFILFFNGFASMAFEIIWTRAFIPTLGNFVYAFAGLLTVYLFATWVGSLIYRKLSSFSKKPSLVDLMAFLTASAFLPIFAGDPQFIEPLFGGASVGLKVFITLASIFPFCLVLGYLTPMLIDQYSIGQSKPAGQMYALNIIGSILGPLVAAYILLPLLGSRESMIFLIFPYFILFLACAIRSTGKIKIKEIMAATVIFLIAISVTIFKSKSYEEGTTRGEIKIRRDHTATVISYNLGPQNKGLLVNGQEMTMGFNQAHKIMAHFPLATLQHKPESAVVIAFGMGTTYRSLLSWDINATAVELVPSVIESFGDYHTDSKEVLNNPKGRIVIDDGRRFLNRTKEAFDLITVDPPPPIEAAGTALLYSEDFYTIVKKRLKTNGIFFHWFPGSLENFQPVIRSIKNSFPYVEVFQYNPNFGFHIFCSMTPIKIPSPAEFSSRLPEKAKQDLMEFFPKNYQKSPEANELILIDSHLNLIKAILRNKLNLNEIIDHKKQARITDDRPYNEYFLLRKTF
jgi:spermidine synthase